MYFRFVDDVMFFHNGPYDPWGWHYRRRHHAEASSQNFQRKLPECATLFDFVVVYRRTHCETGAKFDVYDCFTYLLTYLLVCNGLYRVAQKVKTGPLATICQKCANILLSVTKPNC